MRVGWRHEGGRTRLVGVTELGRMMGIDPNLALSALEGLGRGEAGRSPGGMDPQHKGWGRLHDRGGGGGTSISSSSSSSSNSINTSSGGKIPLPKAPKPPQGPQEKTPPLRE